MLKTNELKELTQNPTPRKRISIIKTIVVKEGSMLYGARQINNTEKAAGLAKELFRHADREMLVVVALDSKCKPLTIEIVAIGDINTCIVSPREVFKSSILSNAVQIIAYHNHLSGDCTPSREDINVTKRLIEAGGLLGIPLLDHIIIGDGDSYLSFRGKDIVSFNNSEPLYHLDIKEMA